MKTLKNSFCILLAAAFAGCATRSPVAVNQPVGPDLAQPRVKLNPGQGQLVVFTALELMNTLDSYHPAHTRYVIYDSNGKLLRRVDNRSGSFYQDPATISLPAGTYKVEGRATNSGVVLVPVIIEQNKTTVVDLEGSTLPQHRPTGAGQWIRLPNGQVVGARME